MRRPRPRDLEGGHMSSAIGAVVTGVLLAVQVPSPSPTPTPPPATAATTLAERSAYHVVFLRLGPSWVKESGVAQAGIREHGQYMTSLSASGQIVLGGPFLETLTPLAASG